MGHWGKQCCGSKYRYIEFGSEYRILGPIGSKLRVISCIYISEKNDDIFLNVIENNALVNFLSSPYIHPHFLLLIYLVFICVDQCTEYGPRTRIQIGSGSTMLIQIPYIEGSECRTAFFGSVYSVVV